MQEGFSLPGVGCITKAVALVKYKSWFIRRTCLETYDGFLGSPTRNKVVISSRFSLCSFGAGNYEERFSGNLAKMTTGFRSQNLREMRHSELCGFIYLVPVQLEATFEMCTHMETDT